MSIKKLLFAVLLAVTFCTFAEDKTPADPLLEAARNGDTQSQLKVADQYFFGKNSRKSNLVIAAYWFKKAADSGNARAQFNYGVCCLKGWGVPPSPQTGFLWISKAASQHLEEALIMQAELLFRGLAAENDPKRNFPAMSADVDKSLAILRKLAAKNNPAAAKTLARLLLSDPELRQKNAVELRKNSASAVRMLPLDVETVLIHATILQNGIGGVTDTREAVRLLHTIENISPEAMARLAEIYEYGFSVPQDKVKALALCRQAANAGSPRAQFALGTKYLEGDMVEHSLARAFELFTKAWHGAYPPAAAALGKCYLNGMGTDKDEAKAFELFMHGSHAGDPESQYRLGICFSKAYGTDRNFAAAVHWFKSAASAGHADAMRELGIAFIEGKGCEVNKSEGLNLLKAASAKGDIQSIEYLNKAR